MEQRCCTSSPTCRACSTPAATSCRGSPRRTHTKWSPAASSAAACARSCRPRSPRSKRASARSPSEKKEGRTLLLHDESPAAVEARESAFILGTYARTPFHPRDGKGARIIDADGRAYWDLLGGIAVNALGHKHPRITKALRDASASLLHV